MVEALVFPHGGGGDEPFVNFLRRGSNPDLPLPLLTLHPLYHLSLADAVVGVVCEMVVEFDVDVVAFSLSCRKTRIKK